MTLKDAMASDLDVFFDTDAFASTVTYNGTEVPAIVDYEEDPDTVPDATLAQMTLTVRASDVADPAYRDAVVIDGDTWYVARTLRSDGLVFVLALDRDERLRFR